MTLKTLNYPEKFLQASSGWWNFQQEAKEWEKKKAGRKHVVKGNEMNFMCRRKINHKHKYLHKKEQIFKYTIMSLYHY